MSGFRDLVRTFLRMDASFELIHWLSGSMTIQARQLPETAMGREDKRIPARSPCHRPHVASGRPANTTRSLPRMEW